MMSWRFRGLVGLALILGVLWGYEGATGTFRSLARAQEAQPTKKSAAKAVPGSPEATTTPNTRYLPPATPKFGGTIGLNASESKPYWPPRIAPKKGAPNVLLVMTDDVGFGVASTFGGPVPTPAMDRIAKSGLRYNKFHSTALCSPTRAALITGRNHHSVHTGVITEMATGFPGYDSLFGPDTASLAEILRQFGYATSWFGKDHNVPAFQASQVGPFDRWPTGMGFDYFYGFVGGDTSQWQPNLFRNTSPIQPYLGKKDWNLMTAMADDAIGWLKQLNSIDPEKPFFCYYVPGAGHAPHHPTPEWIEKFKGKFDQGWDEMRSEILKRQKDMGIIPADAKLTPWPKDLLPEWKDLNADEKKMFARQVEVYAAYVAYADHEIGRVIQAIDDMGKLDNTIVIYISGDNGCSAEGSPIGTPNEVASFNLVEVPVKDQLKKYYDVWGSDKTYPHMSVGWAWAFSTPFKWMKQIAAYFGGTRQGMVISWPKRFNGNGELRDQFHHMIDIAPTVLEACGIPEPVSVNGVPQRPIEGISLAYTFDPKNAKAPSKHKTQYFEMFGNQAIYHEGWIASTVPFATPWKLGATPPADVFNTAKWELYDLTKDFSQFEDIAAANPDKLREMRQLFLMEATKYNVFPLDGSKTARFITPRPSLTAGRNEFSFAGELSGIPHGDAPDLLNKSFTITADVEVPKNDTDGMLLTQGGRFGGYGLYLMKGHPVFTYNFVDVERTRWEGNAALAPGKHKITFDFEYDLKSKGFLGPMPFGKGGVGVLKVDGAEVARKTIGRTIPFIFQWDETFDVGVDTGTSVNDEDYQAPFRFAGQINRVTLQLRPIDFGPELRQMLEEKSRRNNKSSE